MATEIIQCGTVETFVEAGKKAAKVLEQGGLVVFPTETVYGVAASVRSPSAMARLQKLKSRPADKPFSLHVAGPAFIESYVDVDTLPALKKLYMKTMPGPVTYVAHASDSVINELLDMLELPDSARDFLYYKNTIGLRCPDDFSAGIMLSSTPDPIVASSANLHGQPEPHTAQEAIEAIGDQVDLVLAGIDCRFEKPSTVVKINNKRFEILREGVLGVHDLGKLMMRTLLFVCTGNTCRSPMAEMIGKEQLCKRLGIPLIDLYDYGWHVTSAGVFASPGSLATPEAIRAVESICDVDIDPGQHVSQPLTENLINEAEVIFCMTQSHYAAIQAMMPTATDKLMLLDEKGDISDPIGGSQAIYDQTATQILQAIKHRLVKIT